MATIPTYQRQVNETGVTNARISPSAVPDSLYAVAQYNPAVASGLQQLGNAFAQIGRDREDENVASAISEFTRLQADIMHNTDSGILNLQGEAAQNAGDLAGERLTQARTNIAKSRKLTGSAYNKFIRSTDNSQLSSVVTATKYGAQVFGEYFQQVKAQSVNASAIAIGGNPSDRETFEAEATKLYGVYTSMGQDVEDPEALMTQIRKTLVTSTATYLANQDPGSALVFLDTNIGDFTDEEFIILREQVKNKVQPYYEDQIGREIAARHGINDTDGFLADIEENVPQNLREGARDAGMSHLADLRRIRNEQINVAENQAMEILNFSGLSYSQAKQQMAGIVQQLRNSGEAATAANLLDMTDRSFQRGKYAPKPVQAAIDPWSRAAALDSVAEAYNSGQIKNLSDLKSFFDRTGLDPRLASSAISMVNGALKSDANVQNIADRVNPSVSEIVSSRLNEASFRNATDKVNAKKALAVRLQDEITARGRDLTPAEVERTTDQYLAETIEIENGRKWFGLAPNVVTAPAFVGDLLEASGSVRRDPDTGRLIAGVVSGEDGILDAREVKVRSMKEVFK